MVLKVASCLDKNDGIGHFAELGSSWPGEAKTWPKIGLRFGGRAENFRVEGRAAVGPRVLEHVTFLLRPRVLEHVTFIAPRVLQHVTFPRVLQSVVLFLATFWPLLASWSRVRQNDLYHRFCLGKTQLLRPTCKISNGSL